MTREEFLAFDTSKFYEPEYAENLAYMNYLTVLFLVAIYDTDTKYLNAVKKGVSVAPNNMDMWFESKLSASEKYTDCPKFPTKDADFVTEYEIRMKKFLKDYHANIRTIKAASENHTPYFFYEQKSKVYNNIFNQLPGERNSFLELVKQQGFIDLRIMTGYPIDNVFDGDDANMCLDYDLFKLTLEKLTQNLNIKKNKENPRSK